jgi:hypothetical protein
MKHTVITLSISLTLHSLYGSSLPPVTIIVQPQWNILEQPLMYEEFNELWIEVATIFIKKRTSATLPLKQLAFKWQGPKLKQLHGALYEQPPHKNRLIATDQYVLEDSTWDSATQTLFFTFDPPLKLTSLQTWHLVITIPESLEPTVRQGSLQLKADLLPPLLQAAVPPTLIKLAAHAR